MNWAALQGWCLPHGPTPDARATNLTRETLPRAESKVKLRHRVFFDAMDDYERLQFLIEDSDKMPGSRPPISGAELAIVPGRHPR